MDSRAKQRLTGAVILVALFVLLVPELLTGPRERSDRGQFRPTRVCAATPSISIARRQRPAHRRRASNRLPPVALPESRRADEYAARPSPPVRHRPRAPAPRSGATTRAHPPPPMPTAPPQPNPAAHRAARTAAAGTFVVQLGSFGSRDNAERLVRDMTAKGFATFVAPITSNGRELYRVRVGPTRDRASAEALAAQLKRVGQSGSIVPIS